MGNQATKVATQVSETPAVTSNAVSRSTQSGSGAVMRFLERHSIEILSLLLGVGVFWWTLRLLDPMRKEKQKAKQSQKLIQLLEQRNKVPKPLVLDEYEQIVASDIILPEQLNISFDDIGGLEDIKKKLLESLIWPLKKPHLFQRGRLSKPPKGILLYGPPGTGKTMLVKAIAKTSDVIFINLNVANLLQKYLGESEKLITATFSLASKLQPCIIFIDEIDGLFRQRGDSDWEFGSRMKALFMSLWDGLLTDEHSYICIVGTTNRPFDVDEAIQRRMPLTLQIGLPPIEERESILRKILKDEPIVPNFDFRSLARATDTYSGSDLHALCTTASRAPIRDWLESHPNISVEDVVETSNLRSLVLQDFLDAMNEVKATGQSANEYHAQTQSGRRRGAVPTGNTNNTNTNNNGNTNGQTPIVNFNFIQVPNTFGQANNNTNTTTSNTQSQPQSEDSQPFTDVSNILTPSESRRNE